MGGFWFLVSKYLKVGHQPKMRGMFYSVVFGTLMGVIGAKLLVFGIENGKRMKEQEYRQNPCPKK